jgi:hypothetical protein
MSLKSKNVSLLILGLTSMVCSQGFFALVNDPEGPNLLVVIGITAIVFGLSLAVYIFYPSSKLIGLKRLLVAIFVQIMIVTGIYFV